ncbi:MAG TPA: gephyrin-like molybdotransferase Glp [Actinomycetota bacterium]|nr:gephyrin-like molybdotransferase Glp [Actinomycetota bacterium]
MEMDERRSLRTPEEAQRRILDAVKPLPPVALPLVEAWGCVLAEDVTAGFDVPTFPSSSMDGYAVRAADLAGASAGSPVTLRKIGDAPIGHPPTERVETGTAIWIATGAPVPEGADCIAPIEECIEEGDRVSVLKEFTEGSYVRPVGQDLHRGDVVVAAGRRLLGAELGVLSSAGHATALVHPRVRVAVLSTGDELVEPGAPTKYGQIADANSFTLWGNLAEAGALPQRLGIVEDDEDRLRAAMLEGLANADVVITSGGVSVGQRDVVKRILEGMGTIERYKVSMQPGAPQAFGLVEGKPFFGLPGNPVSVFVSYELFIRPALLTMMGHSSITRPELTAVLEEDVAGPAEKTRYSRVRVTGEAGAWRARPTGPPASHLLATVSRANGLAVIPAGTAVARAGDEVRVILFRDRRLLDGEA